MSFAINGANTLAAEVTNISPHGFWIIVHDIEYFLPFSEFPWFKEANVSQITDFQLLHETHLYWPQLDVDLSLTMLDNLEKYPLIYQN